MIDLLGLFSQKTIPNEVQVIVSVLSLDPKVDPDVLSIIGASCAIYISPIPVNLCISAIRIGYKNNVYYCSNKKEHGANLDLVVSGNEKSIFMVESESDQLKENIILDAIKFAKNNISPVIDLIKNIDFLLKNEKWPENIKEQNTTLFEKIKQDYKGKKNIMPIVVRDSNYPYKWHFEYIELFKVARSLGSVF